MTLSLECKLGDKEQICMDVTKSNMGVLFDIFKRALRATSTLPQLPLGSGG